MVWELLTYQHYSFYSDDGSVPLCTVQNGTVLATIQGLAGPWYSCSWNNIHSAVGMSDMPFIHGWVSHARCKPPVLLHVSVWYMSCALLPSMAPIVATVPLHVVSLVRSPYLFKY